jgi:hypothetical protein
MSLGFSASRLQRSVHWLHLQDDPFPVRDEPDRNVPQILHPESSALGLQYGNNTILTKSHIGHQLALAGSMLHHHFFPSAVAATSCKIDCTILKEAGVKTVILL